MRALVSAPPVSSGQPRPIATRNGPRRSCISAPPGPTALAGLETSRLEEAIGDVRDRAAIESALAGCDVLFHVAGYYARPASTCLAPLREGVASVRPLLERCDELACPAGLHVLR